jgi:4-hydroxy-tetrahydrodipicolinate synthase
MKQMVSETLSNPEQGKVIDEKLSLLHRDLFIEPNPVPAKWALVEKNIIQSDMVRLPLVTMEPFNKNIIKEALRHAQR